MSNGQPPEIRIKNWDNMPESEVMTLVKNIIDSGRVSQAGDSFCTITIFSGDRRVYARRTKAGNDIFDVCGPRGEG